MGLCAKCLLQWYSHCAWKWYNSTHPRLNQVVVLGVPQEVWQFGSGLGASKNSSDLGSPHQPLLAFTGIFFAPPGAIATKHYF